MVKTKKTISKTSFLIATMISIILLIPASNAETQVPEISLSDYDLESESLTTKIRIDQEGNILTTLVSEKFSIISGKEETKIILSKNIEKEKITGLKPERSLSENLQSLSESHITREECEKEHDKCTITEEYEYNDAEKQISTANAWDKILSKITRWFADQEEIEKEAEKKASENQEQDIWQEFFEYRKNKGKKGYRDRKTMKIRFRIKKEIEEAEDMKKIMELHHLIEMWCYQNPEKKGSCENMRKELKKKADQFKDRMVEEIDPEEPKAYNKIKQLRALIMAQEKASKGSRLSKDDGNEWFSEENVQKAREEMRKKAEKWWKHHLDKVKSIDDIWQWRALGLCHTEATGGNSLYRGENLEEQVKKKAAEITAKKLDQLDVCDPDKELLSKLMQSLMLEDTEGNFIYLGGCKKILSEYSCKMLKKGDLAAAYNSIFYDAGLDENNPEGLPEPPVVCAKENATTRTKKDTTRNTTYTPTYTEVEGAQETADEQESGSQDSDETSEVTEGSFKIRSISYPYNEIKELDDSYKIENGLNVNLDVEPHSQSEYVKIKGDIENPEQGYIKIEHIPEELIITPEPEEKEVTIDFYDEMKGFLQSETQELEVTIQAPWRPGTECSVEIYEDEDTGWDYTIQNCPMEHDEALQCWNPCGSQPPLKKAEEPGMCHETFEGEVDWESLVPCEPMPVPPPEVADCVETCSMEI